MGELNRFTLFEKGDSLIGGRKSQVNSSNEDWFVLKKLVQIQPNTNQTLNYGLHSKNLLFKITLPKIDGFCNDKSLFFLVHLMVGSCGFFRECKR